MKKIIFFLFLSSLLTIPARAQKKSYQGGEWFKFRIHYGWFNASYATLETKSETFESKKVYHVIGKGKSTGLLDVFFKVDDNYETYIEQDTDLPLKFVRDINEGGHTKNKIIYFDQASNKAKVKNLENNKEETFSTKSNVQDMLSVFYYLRNKIDIDNLKKGDEIFVDLFFDNENYKFKTVFLGHEVLKTKFGKINSLKFRPYVQADRIFKEEESLTFWVSNDENKIPLKIKADLAVGSLEADLEAFKGLAHPFKVIVD
ncbi:Protein of unknown function [Mesonia phycicola]|uniref:ATP-dependent exonuclease n=1 Tax=Mesonia phycicola TaxID=579105 RepID=A0A1M6CQ53_9FLAO|nr:DUF3108 domain-containing protein [Mesonia phycicola]SHI63116.1 Protein of unknown function [Mesonia phycicola]